MIGTTLGPYRLDRELGSGGMGAVYLATVEGEVQGVARGTQVAIKIVHPHLLSTPGFFKRFLREAEVGKSVRHENVVRTYDADATLHGERQVNYMVLEYVQGRNLRKLLEDLHTVPETLLREIAVQVASGLDAIHAQGIVHRDLKPENVILTDDHKVRIMDLGVAKLQEASVALTREGQFAGSLVYAAPEQFTGGVVGPSSDLYSFGVVLYELACGENPFHADTPASVIHAHLKNEPVRLVERRSEISPFLSEFVAALLAKKPAERPASAAATRDLLREGEKSAWWGEREKRYRAVAATLPRITVRRETKLHGRERELQQLRDAWNRAKSGQGTTVLVDGEAGIGRTRFVDAFVRSLEGEDANVLYGSYPPSGGIGGLSEAVIGRFGERGLDESLRPYLTVTPSLVPAFAALLRHENPPTGADPVHGDSLHTVFCHLVRALAAEKPTVWIMEDLHFAPQESRSTLLAMARAIGSDRVLLVATARPDMLPEDDVIHLTKVDGFRRVPLPRLSPREVIDLLRDAFRSDSLTERLGLTIAHKSDGVPFFIFEIVRALRESGVVKQMADGTHVQTEVVSDLEVPSAVKDLIESRLLSLSKEERELVDVASVIGYEFDAGLVASVLERRKVRVLQDLAEIERRSGLVRGEAGRCRFDQYQIHEVLYRGLMPDLRSEYHAMLAQAYAERPGVVGVEPKDLPGDHAVFLASHHLRGSSPPAALPFLMRALGHLDASHRNEEAIDLAQRALTAEGLLAGTERVEVLLRQGNVLGRLGRREEEGNRLREAEAAAAGCNAKLRRKCTVELAWHLINVGRAAEARARLEAALAEASAAGDVDGEASVRNRLALTLQSEGDHAGSAAMLRAIVEPALRQGNTPAAVRVLTALGLAQQHMGLLAEALDAFERRLAWGRENADKAAEGVARVNLGRVLGLCGDLDGARAQLESACDILRSIGERRPEAYALHRLGEVAERAGDAASAERHYKDALALRREIRYPSGVAETLVAFGRLRLAQGRTEESRRLLDEGLSVARTIGAPDEIVLAACLLARAGGSSRDRPQDGLVRPGDMAAAARAALAEFGQRLRATTAMEARFVLWQVARERDDLAEAKRLLDHLVANAPPESRETIVANVPLHRDIAAAAREHGL